MGSSYMRRIPIQRKFGLLVVAMLLVEFAAWGLLCARLQRPILSDQTFFALTLGQVSLSALWFAMSGCSLMLRAVALGTVIAASSVAWNSAFWYPPGGWIILVWLTIAIAVPLRLASLFGLELAPRNCARAATKFVWRGQFHLRQLFVGATYIGILVAAVQATAGMNRHEDRILAVHIATAFAAVSVAALWGALGRSSLGARVALPIATALAAGASFPGRIFGPSLATILLYALFVMIPLCLLRGAGYRLMSRPSCDARHATLDLQR